MSFNERFNDFLNQLDKSLYHFNVHSSVGGVGYVMWCAYVDMCVW